MKRLLSPWVALAVLMTPLSLQAQAKGEGLAHLVPNLILTGIVLPGAMTRASARGTLHVRQPDIRRLAGSVTARHSGDSELSKHSVTD